MDKFKLFKSLILISNVSNEKITFSPYKSSLIFSKFNSATLLLLREISNFELSVDLDKALKIMVTSLLERLGEGILMFFESPLENNSTTHSLPD